RTIIAGSGWLVVSVHRKSEASHVEVEAGSRSPRIFDNANDNRSRAIGWVNISAFSVLGEFVPVSIILRFHLGQKSDEFGRLSDAVQISITLVARIELKTGDGSFS